MHGRISILEIAERLLVGRLAIYTMLEQGSSPESAWAAAGSLPAMPMSNGNGPAACTPALDLKRHKR